MVQRPLQPGESAPVLNYTWSIINDWSVCSVSCAGGKNYRFFFLVTSCEDNLVILNLLNPLAVVPAKTHATVQDHTTFSIARTLP